MNQEQLEQQKMLLALMGTVYGEAKKIDQNLVGASGNLQPTSHVVKNMFEGALRAAQGPPPPPSPQPQPAVQFTNVGPQIPTPTPEPLPYYPRQQESKQIQMVDNSELVVILKGIESNLGKLVDIFTQYEVKVKKSSNRKVSRVSSEDQRSVRTESGEGSSVVDSSVVGQYTDPVQHSKPYE